MSESLEAIAESNSSFLSASKLRIPKCTIIHGARLHKSINGLFYIIAGRNVRQNPLANLKTKPFFREAIDNRDSYQGKTFLIVTFLKELKGATSRCFQSFLRRLKLRLKFWEGLKIMVC